MNTRHTPEPWNLSSNSPTTVISQQSHASGATVSVHVADCQPGNYASREHLPNAARIVACVNACAGIENPELTLRSFRNELEAILKLCGPFIQPDEPGTGNAIAKIALRALALLTPR